MKIGRKRPNRSWLSSTCFKHEGGTKLIVNCHISDKVPNVSEIFFFGGGIYLHIIVQPELPTRIFIHVTQQSEERPFGCYLRAASCCLLLCLWCCHPETASEAAIDVATSVLWCLNCQLREAAGVGGRQAAPNGWWVICAWASNQIQVRAQQARIIVMQLMWRSTTDICLLTMYNKLPTVHKPMVWPTDGQTGS